MRSLSLSLFYFSHFILFEKSFEKIPRVKIYAMVVILQQKEELQYMQDTHTRYVAHFFIIAA